VSIFMDAASAENNLLSYEVSQSPEQASFLPLDQFFEGDASTDATAMFTDCSLFIDTIHPACSTALSNLQQCCNNSNNQGSCNSVSFGGIEDSMCAEADLLYIP